MDQWKQLLDALDVGVVVQELDRRISYANARATSMLGVSSDEFVSRRTDDAKWDVVGSDGRKVEGDDHPGPRALKTGEDVRDVVLGVRREGADERIWVLASAHVSRDAQGRTERVVITISDVSVAQRALHAQEATYRSVFRSMSDGLAIHAPDGSIRGANAAAERVLGLTLDQMMGRTATDPRWRLVKGDGSPVDAGYIPSEVALRTGEAVAARVLGVHRPTGELAWLEVRADPLREPGDEALKGVVAVFTDITKQREAALALERSRAQLQRVLDAVPGVVFQYLRPRERDGRFLFVGGRTRELFGLDPEQVRASPGLLADAVPADARQRLWGAAPVVAGGGAFELDVSLGDGAGGGRWVRVQGRSEETPDGLLDTGVVTDVTEARRLAEVLRGSQRREAMGDIAAGIAHNFNNMLAVILPNLELARAGATRENLEYLDDAERAAASAADLVRRMLMLVRADPGESTEETVDLVPVVNEAVHLCRQIFKREIRTEAVVRVAKAPVRAVRSELSQAVLNLCLNARDAVAGRPSPSITLRLEPDGGDAVRLSVEDTGHGMAPETLRRVGEPFFTTKAPGKGTGLGLATALATVGESGGSWSVASEPGRGTTFTLRWPLTPLPATPEAGDTVPGVRRGRGALLVIDDEPMVRDALERQLERFGYRVVTCATAIEALALLNDRGVDGLCGILLDLSMPGISGAQALPLLRSAAPGVPIVVVTGHVPDAAQLEGAAAVLAKPVRAAALVDAIEAAAKR